MPGEEGGIAGSATRTGTTHETHIALNVADVWGGSIAAVHHQLNCVCRIKQDTADEETDTTTKTTTTHDTNIRK